MTITVAKYHALRPLFYWVMPFNDWGKKMKLVRFCDLYIIKFLEERVGAFMHATAMKAFKSIQISKYVVLSMAISNAKQSLS